MCALWRIVFKLFGRLFFELSSLFSPLLSVEDKVFDGIFILKNQGFFFRIFLALQYADVIFGWNLNEVGRRAF